MKKLSTKKHMYCTAEIKKGDDLCGKPVSKGEHCARHQKKEEIVIKRCHRCGVVKPKDQMKHMQYRFEAIWFCRDMKDCEKRQKSIKAHEAV